MAERLRGRRAVAQRLRRLQAEPLCRDCVAKGGPGRGLPRCRALTERQLFGRLRLKAVIPKSAQSQPYAHISATLQHAHLAFSTKGAY